MERKSFVIWSLALFLFLTPMIIGGDSASAADPIKIGMITSKAGVLAFHGKYAEWAYTMALEEVNAAGGVLGRPLEVIWRDDQAKPDVAAREARDLVFGQKVNFLMGTFITSITNAVSTFAKENKVIFLGSGVGVELTEEKGHPYFFRLSANSTMMSNAMAQLVKQKGYKNVWFLAPDYAFGHQWINDSKRFLKELIPNVNFVGESWPPLGEKDFGAYIADIARAKPDLIFSTLFGRDQGAFVQQAISFGLFKKTQYAGDFGPESLRPLALEVPEGLLGLSYYEFVIPDLPENKKFAEKFKAKFGDFPSRESMHYYNGIHLIALAVKAAGTTETETVVKALENVRFKSPMGELYYRKIDHQISMPMIVGETVKHPGVNYLIIGKDARVIPAEELWHSEAEVKAAREKAKN